MALGKSEEAITDPLRLLEHENLQQNLINKIQELLDTMTPREKKVLELRFGLNGQVEHTLEETGKFFGLHRRRIRQIETKALRKLRHPSRNQILEEYIN